MEAPRKVIEAYKRIAKSYPFYTALKKINKNYYLYKQVVEKRGASSRLTTTYLGRITREGVFLKKDATKDEALETAKEIIEQHGGKVILQKPEEAVKDGTLSASEKDLKILSILSADARIPISAISKELKISRSAASNRIKRLESRYGIRYIAEIDLDKLGYLTYVIMIKFVDKVPPINEIRNDLLNEKPIQLAMFTQGDYDLIIYMLISKYGNPAKEFYELRSRIFPNYDLKLYVAPFYPTYSFVPLSDSFFDMISEQTWSRNRNQPKPEGNYFLRSEYAVLRELNSNGSMNFADIDMKYNLAKDSARYTYQKLIENGTIRRITISMENINIKYFSIILLQKINHIKYMKDREHVLRSIIDEKSSDIMNKYAIEGDIKSPEGVFFIMPVLNEQEMELANDSLRKVEGTTMLSMIATSALVGTLCYRKLDKKYTMQYSILKDEYGLKDAEENIRNEENA